VADEENKKGTRRGEFQLGRHWEKVGPDFGRLQDARHVRTARPALFLWPGKSVDWLLEAGWRVSLSTHRKPPFVRLVVQRAPASGRVTKLTDVFVLFTAALQQVEDDARMDTHLKSGTRSGRTQGRGRARTPSLGRGVAVAALALLSLGAGFWLRGVGEAAHQEARTPEMRLSDGAGQGTAPIAYPLPKKPLPNQATVPCNPKLAELEINGGCWMELAQRPPCINENQAEYQGKCYYPVAKKEEARPPQSLKP
jgi:hypothetical protein